VCLVYYESIKRYKILPKLGKFFFKEAKKKIQKKLVPFAKVILFELWDKERVEERSCGFRVEKARS
jgi:hypothetical protein